MGYAVELYFNPELEAASRELRQRLAEAGVTSALDGLGDRPHVSLAVLHDLDMAAGVALLGEFARATPAFPVSLASVGVFPSSEGVVFLAPVMTDRLWQAHHDFHRRLARVTARPSDLYRPDRWVAHSTLAINVPAAQMGLAVATCLAHFKPLAGVFTEVGLIEFRPVKTLAVLKLGVQTE